ncbi:hypothetical protein GQ53DRAFT_329469 [Thozetella sp. PMI_491]|nr:hypothetical protein GQ53DRAFT_329469 [Thozetella sp. PMI_491]
MESRRCKMIRLEPEPWWTWGCFDGLIVGLRGLNFGRARDGRFFVTSRRLTAQIDCVTGRRRGHFSAWSLHYGLPKFRRMQLTTRSGVARAQQPPIRCSDCCDFWGRRELGMLAPGRKRTCWLYMRPKISRPGWRQLARRSPRRSNAFLVFRPAFLLPSAASCWCDFGAATRVRPGKELPAASRFIWSKRRRT